WALGRLRGGQPLRGFQRASGEAAQEFSRRWRPSASEESEEPPVMSGTDLHAEAATIAAEIGWTAARAPGWLAVVRRTWRQETTETSDDDIVNSFYLDDLERVGQAVARDECGPAMRRFLGAGGGDPAPRTDIWRDADAMRAAVRVETVP